MASTKRAGACGRLDDQETPTAWEATVELLVMLGAIVAAAVATVGSIRAELRSQQSGDGVARPGHG